MSSNPAVSIFAQLQLKPGRLQEQAKEEIKALQSSLSGSKFTAISLNFDIPNDLQQRLQAKLNAIKINAINVPVNFVPTGMGGGGGMGGSGFAGTGKYQQDTHDFEMFQAQNAIRGEQDNNDFQMYLARMGRGGSGSGGGNGIRSSSVVRMSMGNRIQHRNSSLYNPFSPRGLARMAGGAAGVYGGLMAVHAATGMIDAAEVASNPGRTMREFDHIGQRHDVQSDSFMQNRAGALSGISGEKKVLEAFESIPLIGTLGHFVDALMGATKGLQDQEYAIRRSIEIHQAIQKMGDETTMKDAELTHDPAKILQAKQDVENQTAGTLRRAAEKELADAEKNRGGDYTSTKDSREAVLIAKNNLKRFNEQDDSRLRSANAQKEQVDEIQKLEHDLSPASILATEEGTASTQARMAADPAEAMRQSHASAQLKLRRSIEQKLKDPNRNPEFDEDIRKQGVADTSDLIAKQISESVIRQQNEKLSIRGYGNESDTIGLRMSGKTDEAERKALKDKQQEKLDRLNGPGGNKDEAKAYADTAKKERDELDQKITLARTKEAGDSTAKLAEIKGSADEKMLSAEGHTSDALMESTKRTGDARVAALKREADSTVDAQKKTELLAEARATETANVKQLAAITKEQARNAALDLRKSGESLGAATMGSLGNQFGASQKRISDSYQEKVDAIRLKGGAGMADDLASAANERDEANLGLKAQRYASNTAMAIQGQDAAARSHGQEGVGAVLSFADEIRKKYQDAGGDKDQIKLVDDYKTAEVAARRRELRPKDAGMKYGGAEYHDVLQQQINTGFGHGEAMKKLMGVADINAGNAGTPEGMAKESAKDLSDAAKALTTAATQFRRKAV